jgi:hypothetical protein
MPPLAVVESSGVRRHENGDRTTSAFDHDATPGLHLPKGFGKMGFEIGDRESLVDHMTSFIGHYDLFGLPSNSREWISRALAVMRTGP